MNLFPQRSGFGAASPPSTRGIFPKANAVGTTAPGLNWPRTGLFMPQSTNVGGEVKPKKTIPLSCKQLVVSRPLFDKPVAKPVSKQEAAAEIAPIAIDQTSEPTKQPQPPKLPKPRQAPKPKTEHKSAAREVPQRKGRRRKKPVEIIFPEEVESFRLIFTPKPDRVPVEEPPDNEKMMSYPIVQSFFSHKRTVEPEEEKREAPVLESPRDEPEEKREAPVLESPRDEPEEKREAPVLEFPHDEPEEAQPIKVPFVDRPEPIPVESIHTNFFKRIEEMGITVEKKHVQSDGSWDPQKLPAWNSFANPNTIGLPKPDVMSPQRAEPPREEKVVSSIAGVSSPFNSPKPQVMPMSPQRTEPPREEKVVSSIAGVSSPFNSPKPQVMPMSPQRTEPPREEKVISSIAGVSSPFNSPKREDIAASTPEKKAPTKGDLLINSVIANPAAMIGFPKQKLEITNEGKTEERASSHTMTSSLSVEDFNKKPSVAYGMVNSASYMLNRIKENTKQIPSTTEDTTPAAPVPQRIFSENRTKLAVDTLIKRMTGTTEDPEPVAKEKKSGFIPPFFRNATTTSLATEPVPHNEFEEGLFTTKKRRASNRQRQTAPTDDPVAPKTPKRRSKPKTKQAEERDDDVVEVETPNQDLASILDLNFEALIATALQKSTAHQPAPETTPIPTELPQHEPKRAAKPRMKINFKFTDNCDIEQLTFTNIPFEGVTPAPGRRRIRSKQVTEMQEAFSAIAEESGYQPDLQDPSSLEQSFTQNNNRCNVE